ncbi:IclR family transcriptional regulator [Amycolatopsis alkalitolerans]|uniref:Glycerol operon regulatory protein n=1 Tax=Amycolatopsis alkalitolerans TaxID=2547244 RepID=A0A5C4LX05_9PSEU|nr:IclR family transcriptional regulator [Amycolatopsis alkalitolerans]TNC22393.1 IclR family transcriptional regulator [Amycolatopsis alkalitolerans]
MADMVGKALRLLSVLGSYPEGVALSELSRIAGYPVSTTHRLLSSLQGEGFARSDPASKRYSLGLRLFELGQHVSQARGFAGVALPVMQALSDETGEPTLMSVLDGHNQVYVHAVQGRQRLQIRGEPGERGPLHCTSMGKCLVAFASQREQLVASLELTPLGPRTITSRAAFAAEIDSVRRKGFAVADEEHEAGIRAVGVPICGPDGVAIAALSTAGPAYRLSVAELEGFVPALRAAARELAALLPR